VVLERDISWIIGSLLLDGSLHCGDGVEVSEKGGQTNISNAMVFATLRLSGGVPAMVELWLPSEVLLW
jgi:hypothetical protein